MVTGLQHLCEHSGLCAISELHQHDCTGEPLQFVTESQCWCIDVNGNFLCLCSIEQSQGVINQRCAIPAPRPIQMFDLSFSSLGPAALNLLGVAASQSKSCIYKQRHLSQLHADNSLLDVTEQGIDL